MQGPFYIHKGKKAKGEEKPEEELMGKRKSSPRLATTSSNDVVTVIISIMGMLIPPLPIFFHKGRMAIIGMQDNIQEI